MSLIGSPNPSTESYAPRLAAAAVVAAMMLALTIAFLGALVVGTGGDPNAGLTYQLGLMWSLFATIGAVAGAILLTKRWAARRGPWKAALVGGAAALGLALAGLTVGYAVLMVVYRVAGA